MSIINMNNLSDICVLTQIDNKYDKSFDAYWMTYDYINAEQIRKQKVREAKVESVISGDTSKLDDLNEYEQSDSSFGELSLRVVKSNVNLIAKNGNEDFDKMIITKYLSMISNHNFNDTWQFDKDKVRQLLTKMLRCANKMAVNSRIGPPNVVIISDTNYDVIENTGMVINGNITSLKIYKTNLIGNDKIVLLRVNSNDRNGINLYQNENYWAIDVHGKPMIEWINII